MADVKEPLSSSRVGSFAGAPATWQALPRPERLRIAAVVSWIVVATLAFIQPLTNLMRYAVGSELFSYIPLVPFVAGYLLFTQRKTPGAGYRRSVGPTLILGGICLAAVAAATGMRGRISLNDDLALMAIAYVSLIAAGGFLFFGSKWMAAAAFPVGFLIFLAPLPDAVVHWLEGASVLASADVSAFLFNITGTPLLRDAEIFVLPGIVLRIAEECSGIHSSWVLFITSLVASHLFLDSPWRRLILVAFVLPLAIIRNSFRILVIGLLCVHVGPHMIDSLIHRRGGPVFFALSLIPLSLLLVWLRRREQ